MSNLSRRGFSPMARIQAEKKFEKNKSVLKWSIEKIQCLKTLFFLSGKSGADPQPPQVFLSSPLLPPSIQRKLEDSH